MAFPLLLNRVQRGGGGASVPVFNFDSALATFTPNMAIRAGKLFAGAPMVQGGLTNNKVDWLSYSIGSQISGSFYSTVDAYQGSVSMIWTPEGDFGVDQYLFYLDGVVYLRYEGLNNRFRAGLFTNSFVVNHTLVAGSPVSLVVRWDTKNTLDGTSKLCLSINDVHTFINVTPNSGTLAIQTIGARGAADSPANARIEGLTIYRRPLFDGLYGCDVGNGDEIALIYNSGTFRDPCEVTGSWDVVFCLPTNATPGTLSTGTGHAWTHPHASNLLTDGWLATTAPGSWSSEGTPTSVADITGSERIYNWGYQIATDAPNEGIYQDETVVAGADWVIRVVAHSNGVSQPKVILYDQTGGAEIGSLLGTTTSTKTDPNVLIFTGEAPAGCTTLRVKVVDAVGNATMYVHQIELLANLITNPSMESWQGTTPDIPVGWTNSGLSAGQTAIESTIVHSGANSFKFVSADNVDRIQQTLTLVNGGFYCMDAWGYLESGGGRLEFGDPNSELVGQSSLSTEKLIRHESAAWTHDISVVRAKDTSVNLQWRALGAGQTGYIDDVYIIALTAVSLTVTPASLANSTEGSGIRVDGKDKLTQPVLETSLSNDRIEIRFKYTPRHGIADVLKFGVPSAWIFLLTKDSSNYILLYHPAASDIRCEIAGSGTSIIGSTATGVTGIDAGTEYDVVFVYTKGVGVVITFDGVEKYNKPVSASADFTDLTGFTFYAGSYSDGLGQVGAVFANPA